MTSSESDRSSKRRRARVVLPGTRRSGRKRRVKWVVWLIVAALVAAAAWFGYQEFFSGPAVEFSGP